MYFIVSLVLCFVFSYRLTEDMLLDLRIVPFLIGGLYMGISPLLGLVLIIIRGFYGIDIGFYLAFLFYGIFSWLIWYISPWFLRLSSKCRILFSVGMTFLISLLFLMGIEILSPPIHTLDFWFAYLFVPPLGVAMISYIIECIRGNILLRQSLVKAEKLEAVEQMGAAISHEIRNPLTSAMGFVQLLEDDQLDLDKRNQYLAILKEELQSAENVIKDYLTFSKPTIECVEVFQVEEELNQILKLLQPSANWNSVKVVSDYNSLNYIQGDCQKFHQCFVNVIKNAIESMPNGGTLSVSSQSNSTHVTIKIQDTGVGMTKEQIERLGEPYYSTKGDKGTGLGVMVANSIVKAMNGTIQVKSKVGAGTIFTFNFQLYT
ncbi:HAMP domain-containing histidine kinase [Paenisporosarcina quisquiliarum]|uniref:histidine kinase n=1 Tax=Paenisporosarcina quisquiliarum TaxID=365346 RepID=A0A9X3LFK3_9BACL|nr:HAMP domain-containing sensor histidine kinase [Paenisporosarcina quisquiliarum]MCZ8537026.1 HAMP domain-containing histidine kinase [Paenisporosarcina quisquiliarum]